MAPMGFRELWDLFAELYPGKWALQVFPDAKNLLDQSNKYHLFVYSECPKGLNLFESSPKGSVGIAAPPSRG